MNSRQFAIVAAFTFFVGMVWLVADIIFNTKASVPISDKLQVLLEPVNPNFNTRVLDLINSETLDSSEVIIDEGTPVPTVTELPPVDLNSEESDATSSPEINQ